MSNVLQFTLGLATGGFLTAAQRAQSAMTGLVKSGLALPGIGAALAGGVAGFGSAGAAMAKTFEQIEKGAALKDLSARTGETVANLYSLQKAFSHVGVGAEAVPTILGQVQKALGGVNEMGEPTKDIFAAIGLEVDTLKKMDAPAALQAIFEKLSRLDRASATTVATKIFGRGGAGDVLQAARQMDDFGEAMERAAEKAALFQQNAAAFEAIDKGLARLKEKFNGFWASIAAAAAPGFQSAIDAIAGLDVDSIGKRIGKAITVGIEAVRTDQFGDLLRLGLEAGLTDFSNVFAVKIDEWAGRLRSLLNIGNKDEYEGFVNPLSFEEKAKAFTGGIGAGLAGFFGKAGGVFSDTINEWADGEIAKADELFNRIGLGDGLIGTLSEKIAQAGGGEAGALPNPAREQLAALVESLAGSAASRRMEEIAQQGAGEALATAQRGGRGRAGNQPQASNLERIGAVFSFGNMGATDYTRKTADNTGQMVNLLREISKRINQGPVVPDFTNIA